MKKKTQFQEFLQKVDLGSNGFTIEKININNVNNISLQSITELWASNGVFDDDTIDDGFDGHPEATWNVD